MNKKAIYPGSFDPFTNGHLDIVKKASDIFDEVVIVISNNANKIKHYPVEKMEEAIRQTLMDNKINNCTVIIYDGLVAKFAKENDIKYMVRGLRNNMDYNYEENIAEINKVINPELECVYLRADNVAISSSMVRELHGYGQDVKLYVPKAIYDLMVSQRKF